MVDEPKIWFAVDIVVDPAGVEAIEFALNELDSLGSEVDSLRKAKDEPLTVTGFFDALPGDAEISSAVGDALRIYDTPADTVKTIATRTVEETDWLAEWKKYWRPTHIGRFIIAPPWETVTDTDKIVIRIEPNMAFGTGTHETTQLCLAAIGEVYEPSWSVLDVGTGTGILSIAAAKLAELATERGGVVEFGPKDLSVPSVAKILACDTDSPSVAIARENAVLNGVGHLIEFVDGPIDDGTPVFDLVCANLTLDVISPILPMLVAKARSVLLLSGILVTQRAAIAAGLDKLQISNYKIETAGEWLSVLVNIS